MVWHIKKTSILGSDIVYYKGNNSRTEDFDERSTYTSQAKAKEVDYIWGRSKWDVTAVNEG